jgi:hypothetical protein
MNFNKNSIKFIVNFIFFIFITLVVILVTIFKTNIKKKYNKSLQKEEILINLENEIIIENFKNKLLILDNDSNGILYLKMDLNFESGEVFYMKTNNIKKIVVMNCIENIPIYYFIKDNITVPFKFELTGNTFYQIFIEKKNKKNIFHILTEK